MVSYDYTYFTCTRSCTLYICLCRRFGWALDKQLLYRKDIYVPDSWVLRAQLENHRQNVDRVLGFFSSSPNWDSPSPAGECVLPSFGLGGDTNSLREMGWGGGVPIQTRGQTLWYSRYLPVIYMYALCVHRHGGGKLYTDNTHICVRSS